MQVVQFNKNRTEAEKSCRLLIEYLLGFYNLADKIDIETRKVKKLMEFGNETTFVLFNGFAGSMVEIMNASGEMANTAKSPQQKDFAQNYRSLVEQMVGVNVGFVGANDPRSFLLFVNVWRGVVDINIIHKKIVIDLQQALGLLPGERLKEITKNAKMYVLMKNERMTATYQACLEAPIPRIFTSLSRDDITRLKRTVDENADALQSIDQFHAQNNQQTVKSVFEMQEKKKKFSADLLVSTQEANAVMKAWVEQYTAIVLKDN